MCGSVLCRQVGVLSQRVGHLVHQAARLQTGSRSGNHRMRQVENGREGGAVAQARRGSSHERVTAHAACRNLNHVADLTAQLRGENTDVLLGGGQGFNSYAEAAGGACLQLFNGVFGAHNPKFLVRGVTSSAYAGCLPGRGSYRWLG